MNQELDRLEGFRNAKDVVVGALQKGGWVYRRIRDAESSVLEALRCALGQKRARDAARDKEIAALRTKLTDWFEIVEGSLSAERKFASKRVKRGGKNSQDEGASHWLARKAVVLHGVVLTSLEPKVTERQFVASVLDLAKAGTDVDYHVRLARAALSAPLVMKLEQWELTDLITSAVQPAEE